jgi:glycosyltransferase involved in cell wall biosynthesis
VSVVVPTHDREAALRRALEAWDRQRVDGVELEVVVVDDGSRDATGALLESFSPRTFELRCARQENAGPAAARNRGLALARGELVLFTGDDIVPCAGLLAEHLRAHREQADPLVAIVGQTSWPDGAPTTTTMRHVDGVGAQQFSYAYMRDGEEYDFRHFYTSNVSVGRALLEREPEGFSTDFRRAAFEDAEYSYRLSLHGMRIHYRAAARAEHHHHYVAASFYRRQQACGEMAAVLYDKHPELRKWLGLSELEWIALGRVGEERQLDDQTLAEAERRLVRLAGFYDGAEARPVNGLLLALFRYAYLEGLARAHFDGDEASAVLETVLRGEILRVVAHFAHEMRDAGIPVPAADTAFLLGLGACPGDGTAPSFNVAGGGNATQHSRS